MATYAIGDVQGCLESLKALLHKIDFNSEKDCLWFCGDLVNRGPQSLETLRFIQALGPKTRVVLGNHDVALLAVACGALPYNSQYHTFKDILEAPDKKTLIAWLRKQPLIYQDTTLGYTMVHAGILAPWDPALALNLAHELEQSLQEDALIQELLCGIFEEKPTHWDPELQGIPRLRFILNSFTRLRFCTKTGVMAFLEGYAEQQPPNFYPWFEIQHPETQKTKWLFGHWSLLKKRCPAPNVFALDTGCVWGGCLTALRLEDACWFSIPCLS